MNRENIVRKNLELAADLLAEVQALANSDPAYHYKGEGSANAVIRDAIVEFLRDHARQRRIAEYRRGQSVQSEVSA
jgi:hypothetical protein